MDPHRAYPNHRRRCTVQNIKSYGRCFDQGLDYREIPEKNTDLPQDNEQAQQSRAMPSAAVELRANTKTADSAKHVHALSKRLHGPVSYASFFCEVTWPRVHGLLCWKRRMYREIINKTVSGTFWSRKFQPFCWHLIAFLFFKIRFFWVLMPF